MLFLDHAQTLKEKLRRCCNRVIKFLSSSCTSSRNRTWRGVKCKSISNAGPASQWSPSPPL